MSKITGKKLQFAGIRLETNQNAELRDIFAVFAEKQHDPEQLPSQTIFEAMDKKNMQARQLHLSVEKLLTLIHASQVSLPYEEDSRNEVLADMGKGKLKRVLNEMIKMPELIKPEAKASYFIPVTGKNIKTRRYER